MKSGSSLFLLGLSQQPWVGLLPAQLVCVSSSLQTHPRELILSLFFFFSFSHQGNVGDVYFVLKWRPACERHKCLISLEISRRVIDPNTFFSTNKCFTSGLGPDLGHAEKRGETTNWVSHPRSSDRIRPRPTSQMPFPAFWSLSPVIGVPANQYWHTRTKKNMVRTEGGLPCLSSLSGHNIDNAPYDQAPGLSTMPCLRVPAVRTWCLRLCSRPSYLLRNELLWLRAIY